MVRFIWARLPGRTSARWLTPRQTWAPPSAARHSSLESAYLEHDSLVLTWYLSTTSSNYIPWLPTYSLNPRSHGAKDGKILSCAGFTYRRSWVRRRPWCARPASCWDAPAPPARAPRAPTPPAPTPTTRGAYAHAGPPAEHDRLVLRYIITLRISEESRWCPKPHIPHSRPRSCRRPASTRGYTHAATRCTARATTTLLHCFLLCGTSCRSPLEIPAATVDRCWACNIKNIHCLITSSNVRSRGLP